MDGSYLINLYNELEEPIADKTLSMMARWNDAAITECMQAKIILTSLGRVMEDEGSKEKPAGDELAQILYSVAEKLDLADKLIFIAEESACQLMKRNGIDIFEYRVKSDGDQPATTVGVEKNQLDDSGNTEPS